MQPYQAEYIENCKTIHTLTKSPFLSGERFDRGFDMSIENMHRARGIARRNVRLLEEELMPVLDDLYQQSIDVLDEMEEFGEALVAGEKALDIALACQIHESLLRAARRLGDRVRIIRLLYKLGMARFAVWNTLTGLTMPETEKYTWRMRYCFIEAGSYIKYYDEFPDETKGYILRAVANTYLGDFDDWKAKRDCVRRSMQVFNDPYYREKAPGLPWDVYMHKLHLQMTSVVPYDVLENALSPEDVADMMESAHLIYEVQYEKARESGQQVLAHSLLPYYGLEFSCGLSTKEELLKRIERLLDDDADPGRFDANSNYQIVSAPAFYIQYLVKMPEFIPPRRRYITYLYQRLMRYITTMPLEKTVDQLQLYVRQVLSVFLEVPGGITYEEMSLTVMSRFAPELYAHGYTVGRMAQAICEVIAEGEPGYFDDIPELADIPAGEKKQASAGQFAMSAGLLHDVGKMNFTGLSGSDSRLLLSSEEELLRIHTLAGGLRLDGHDSTRKYADVARGHHRWYDGSDGYPDSFQRKKSPYRALVDVIAVADFLDNGDDEERPDPIERDSHFEERMELIQKLAGRRFSPMVTAWMRDQELTEKLRVIYHTGHREGFRLCFDRAQKGAKE